MGLGLLFCWPFVLLLSPALTLPAVATALQAGTPKLKMLDIKYSTPFLKNKKLAIDKLGYIAYNVVGRIRKEFRVKLKELGTGVIFIFANNRLSELIAGINTTPIEVFEVTCGNFEGKTQIRKVGINSRRVLIPLEPDRELRENDSPSKGHPSRESVVIPLQLHTH